MFKGENLALEQNWDKVFPKNSMVDHQKVTFVNRFGITLAADVYTPKNYKGKLSTLAVAGPFGAVKEMSSGLYAQEMASRGFLTLAFDPSFTGESGGLPRNTNSPDINTEDFSAAIDYLSTLDNVNPEAIGIIGICGWGGFALNAAAIDTRIKATVTSTMYDMSRVTAYGYFYSLDEDGRYALRQKLNKQRTEDFKNGVYQTAGGLPTVESLPANAPSFLKDYVMYYMTKRGYHKRCPNANGGFLATANMSLLNAKLLSFASEIRNPVLMIHGEKAHSLYFSQAAFKLLKDDNKELMIIPGAVHTDLYDNYEFIPFDKIESFLKTNLK
jgi:fermentation-respiration switch protein FrsA (DUF1100 family)